MNNTVFAFVLCLLALLLWDPPAEAMDGGVAGRLTIEGSGDSQTLLHKIGVQFEAAHPGSAVLVPDSVGSSGGIKAVGEGRADLGRVARRLNEAETALNLRYVPFARCPVAMAINRNVAGVDSLTGEQIVAVYAGRYTDWAQLGGAPGKIYPLSREDGDSSRRILDAVIPGFKELDRPAAKVLYTTPELQATLQRYPNTIGYGPVPALVDDSVRLLAIDGIAPTAENVAAGRYGLSIELAVVHRVPPARLAEAFLRFLLGPQARKVIVECGCLPVSN